MQSLLNRLSGPSDQKAGLKRDPEEVKRIIYEASKGSSFFINEQKKDEQLTAKVDAMLARLEGLISERRHSLVREEKFSDEILARLEKERDLSQVIVVFDADAFFANCHILADPALKGVAFGVGNGVLCTASYEARQYGCRSAMAGFVAKKLCPHLVTVPLDFKLYKDKSQQMMEILASYGGDISVASVDEAYCCITELCQSQSPEAVVAAIRARVLEETGLSVSAGIAPTTVLGKIAADVNKPNGQCFVPPTREACMSFMSRLSVRKIPGIGRVTERILNSLGIETVQDIYTHRGKLFLLREQIDLEYLLRMYLGLGPTAIKKHDRSDRKSYGEESTFHDVSDVAVLTDYLRTFAHNVSQGLKSAHFSARTVHIHLKLNTFQRITRSYTQGPAIYFNDADTLFRHAKTLFDKEVTDYERANHKPLTLRLIGLRVSNLRDDKLVIGDDRPLDRWFAKGGASACIDLTGDETEKSHNMLSVEEEVSRQLVHEEELKSSQASSVIVVENEPKPNNALNEVTCPVCSKTLVGTESALSRHVETHFEDKKEKTHFEGKKNKRKAENPTRKRKKNKR